MKKSILIRRRRKSKGFNPNHEEVNKAQSDYFKRGGTITFLKPKDVNLEEFVKNPEKNSYADEFLMENNTFSDSNNF